MRASRSRMRTSGLSVAPGSLRCARDDGAWSARDCRGSTARESSTVRRFSAPTHGPRGRAVRAQIIRSPHDSRDLRLRRSRRLGRKASRRRRRVHRQGRSRRQPLRRASPPSPITRRWRRAVRSSAATRWRSSSARRKRWPGARPRRFPVIFTALPALKAVDEALSRGCPAPPWAAPQQRARRLGRVVRGDVEVGSGRTATSSSTEISRRVLSSTPTSNLKRVLPGGRRAASRCRPAPRRPIVDRDGVAGISESRPRSADIADCGRRRFRRQARPHGAALHCARRMAGWNRPVRIVYSRARIDDVDDQAPSRSHRGAHRRDARRTTESDGPQCGRQRAGQNRPQVRYKRARQNSSQKIRRRRGRCFQTDFDVAAHDAADGEHVVGAMRMEARRVWA